MRPYASSEDPAGAEGVRASMAIPPAQRQRRKRYSILWPTAMMPGLPLRWGGWRMARP